MAKEDVNALANKIDLEPIETLKGRVEVNGKLINEIVDNIVNDYCKPLDDYMKFIRSVLSDGNYAPTDEELDDFTLNIPVLLYFTGEAQESVGIREDVAKGIKQELYSDVYNQASGTIGDKTASAELATQAEYITHMAYQRAYKKIKLKMDNANETLQSVKKVISRRMTEYEISKVDPARVGGR